MGVGDCQQAFGDAAREDGVELVGGMSVSGVSDAGHLRLPADCQAVSAALAGIFRALGGDEANLRSGQHAPLKMDWGHRASRTVIEIDEFQHFTTDRMLSLESYPQDARLGFDRDEYITLCRRHRMRADEYRASKDARGFRRRGGRRAQRAYFDALRDLAIPVLGLAPVVRVPVFDDDGRSAYRRHRAALRVSLGVDAP